MKNMMQFYQQEKPTFKLTSFENLWLSKKNGVFFQAMVRRRTFFYLKAKSLTKRFFRQKSFFPLTLGFLG